jgi:hypothetical protein
MPVSSITILIRDWRTKPSAAAAFLVLDLEWPRSPRRKVNYRSDPKLKNVKTREHSSFRLFAAQNIAQVRRGDRAIR